MALIDLVQLYPHQQKAVDELSNGKILRGGVGSGKSLTAAAYYVKNEVPRDVYVFTTAMKRDALDWEEEFTQFGVGNTKDTSTAGVLRVDSWNNIAKYKNVRGAFFIFDEQRLVGSGAWAKAFLHITKPDKNNRWIVLSATPGDTWMDYVALFIANGFFHNRTQFKHEHVVYSTYTKFPMIVRYLDEPKLMRLRDSITVDMPYARHTVRHSHDVTVKVDRERLAKVYKDRWNIFEDRPIRNVSELFQVVKRITYSDPSRLEAVREVMKKHPRLIIFYNFDYELEALRTLAEPRPVVLNVQQTGNKPDPSRVFVGRPSKWGNPFVIGRDGSRSEVLSKYRDYILKSDLMDDLHELRGKDLVCFCSPKGCHADILLELANKNILSIAEWNGHKHEEVPETERWVYLVQYTAGAEGWNCITTDTILFYSLTYSYKQWTQAHGRTDRLNTPYTDLQYYVLYCPIGLDPAVRDSQLQKKDFNERRFVSRFLSSEGVK